MSLSAIVDVPFNNGLARDHSAQDLLILRFNFGPRMTSIDVTRGDAVCGITPGDSL